MSCPPTKLSYRAVPHTACSTCYLLFRHTQTLLFSPPFTTTALSSISPPTPPSPPHTSFTHRHHYLHHHRPAALAKHRPLPASLARHNGDSRSRISFLNFFHLFDLLSHSRYWAYLEYRNDISILLWTPLSPQPLALQRPRFPGSRIPEPRVSSPTCRSPTPLLCS